MKTFISDISNQEFPLSERVSGKSIRTSIFNLILKDYPNFTVDMALSGKELNKYRERYIEQMLSRQEGSLNDLDKTVMDSLTEQNTLTDKIDGEDVQVKTFGQFVADKVAEFGGSWTFIITFGFFLAFWILLNIYWLGNRGFDPYPFILLNLILSTLAALQAPVIMMSQNRQEEKDRERARKDYMINLKSEIEIRMLHEKIDHLIINEQQEVIEIHKVQIEMMNDILKRLEKNKLVS